MSNLRAKMRYFDWKHSSIFRVNMLYLTLFTKGGTMTKTQKTKCLRNLELRWRKIRVQRKGVERLLKSLKLSDPEVINLYKQLEIEIEILSNLKRSFEGETGEKIVFYDR